MAMGICSLSASATDWGLYHNQGAPSSDIRTHQTITVHPIYTHYIKGYCSSYNVSTGRVDATLAHADNIHLDSKQITGTGYGSSYNFTNTDKAITYYITVEFSDSTYARGSAYGAYK